MSTYGQGGSRNWRAIRQQVLERDNYECQLGFTGCQFAATEVDHATSIAELGIQRGGEGDAADCCRSVCKACHEKLNARQRVAGQQRMNALRQRRKHLPTQSHPGEM